VQFPALDPEVAAEAMLHEVMLFPKIKGGIELRRQLAPEFFPRQRPGRGGVWAMSSKADW
jgi:hypothetical protein